MFVALS
jgi:hypothetical protein